MKGNQLYNLSAVVQATAANVGSAGHVLMGVSLLGGTGNSTVSFYNHMTAATGTALLVVNCLAYSNQFVDLSSVGGIHFTTGIWCAVTGTSAIAYCWVG